MGLDVPRIDGDGLLKLRDRFGSLSTFLVQKAEVVVNLGACAVFLEQRTIVRDRVVEVADPLVVERKAEMIVGLRRRHVGRDT